MNIEDYIHPETGEPTIPLDEPWKRRLWQDYLRRKAKECIAEANERLGRISDDKNIPGRRRFLIRRLGKRPKLAMVPRPGSIPPGKPAAIPGNPSKDAAKHRPPPVT